MAVADYSYTKLPTGGYQFQRPGEPPIRMPSGPGAEQLARRIAQTQANLAAYPDLRVAGPGGGFDQAAFERRLEEQSPKNQLAGISFENLPGSTPQSRAAAAERVGVAPAASAVAASPTQQTGYKNLGLGYRMSPAGRIEEWVPATGGSPGITTEQLQQRDADAVSQRVAKTETRQGGFEPSREYLEGVAANFQERERLAEDIRQSNLRTIQTESATVADTEALRAQHRQEQEQLQRTIDTRVKRDEEIAERARKEYEGAKLDPNRIFSGEGGALRRITYALSSALGAFGATLGRTENFALNQINSIIDNDIRAQENEIATKKDRADNALAQLQRSGLSQEQSRMLLRQIQLDHIGARAEKLRAQAKSTDVDNQAKALQLGLQREQLDFLEKYRRESEGVRSEEIRSQYAHAKAATAGRSGYWRESKDQLGTAKGLQGVEEGRADIGLKQANTEKARRGTDTEAGAQASTAERREMALMGDLKARVTAFVQAHGGTIDPVTGKISGGNFPSGVAIGQDETAAKTKAEAELTEIGSAYANFVNGGAEAPPAQKEAMTPKLEGSFGFGAGPTSQLEAVYQGALIREAQRAKGAAPAAAPAATPQTVRTQAAPGSRSVRVELRKE